MHSTTQIDCVSRDVPHFASLVARQMGFRSVHEPANDKNERGLEGEKRYPLFDFPRSFLWVAL
jgi:hypothetical protein